MPAEGFINPYNFARLPKHPFKRNPGELWDRATGLTGDLICELINETPLFIPAAGPGTDKHFAHSGLRRTLTIPGTSLKGALRCVAEAITGSCSPFADSGRADGFLTRCKSNDDLCICCRLFGFLNRGNVLRGRVSFGDASATDPATHADKLVVIERFGQPKPEHGSFYYANGSTRGRKFYWHQPSVTTLEAIPRSRSAKQAGPKDAQIRPVLPGAHFEFTVRYLGLSAEELGLLLWTLDPGGAHRHKIGYGKGVGLGTVRVEIKRIREMPSGASAYADFDALVNTDIPSDRVKQLKQPFTSAYAANAGVTAVEGDDLFAIQDDNLTDLDALLTPHPELKPIVYPSFNWFKRRAAEQLPTVAETLKGKRLPLET